MRFILSTIVISLALVAELVTALFDAHKNSLRRKHHVGSQHVSVNQNVTAKALKKRFSDAQFTFYIAGLGACGKTNSGSDFIVALNSDQYNDGSHCFETINISVNGKTHLAEIVDKCPGCPFGGLDFSEGLFDFFAEESVGVLTGSWNFGGSTAPPPPPSPSPSPPTKPKLMTNTPPPPPPPKTTQHHTASTSGPPATTHTSAVPTSKSNDSPFHSSTATLKAASTPEAPPPVNNIEQLYLAFVQMGGIVMAARGAPDVQLMTFLPAVTAHTPTSLKFSSPIMLEYWILDTLVPFYYQ